MICRYGRLQWANVILKGLSKKTIAIGTCSLCVHAIGMHIVINDITLYIIMLQVFECTACNLFTRYMSQCP